MPLPQKKTKLFVIAFVALAFVLSVFATVSIYQGWNDEDFQEHVQAAEETHTPPVRF
ncbi:MAG: hypothetical protein AAF809_08250 [Bacteroidota bacterium]